MRFQYEGKDIEIDTNPWGEESIRVRVGTGENYIFSFGELQNTDKILPGPIITGEDNHGHTFYFFQNGNLCYLHYKGKTFVFRREQRKLSSTPQSSSEIYSPMPGKIIKINCNLDEEVKAEETLLVLEAMKMEHHIRAPYNARVKKIHCILHETISQDQLLMELESL